MKDKERQLRISFFVLQGPKALGKQVSESVRLFTTVFPWALGTDPWVPEHG